MSTSCDGKNPACNFSSDFFWSSRGFEIASGEKIAANRRFFISSIEIEVTKSF